MIILYLIFLIPICTETYLSNGTCYKNICFNFSSTEVNYSTAIQECRKLNLTLAFVSDQSAQLCLKDYINSMTDSFYIGLKYIHNERFVWDCESLKLPQLIWSSSLDNLTKESCVFLQDGLMKMGLCHDVRKFICSNVDHSIPKIIADSWKCPKGFFQYLNKCYQMNFQCNEETRTWSKAQEYCSSLSPRSTLVVVKSMIEQEFLTAIMTKSPQASWTGYRHLRLENRFPIFVLAKYGLLPPYEINFKENEPNNPDNEKCLMVYHRLSDVGRINDENCETYLNYICQSPLVAVNDTKIDPEILNPLFQRGDCANKYYEFNETCYYINFIRSSYDLASKACKEKLLYVNGRIDIAFIRSLMAFKGVSEIWLSVSDDFNDGIQLLINETASKTKFVFNKSSCYVLKSKEKGLHIANSCSDEKPSICYNYLPNHEKNLEHLHCPMDYVKVGKKCVIVKSNHFDFLQSMDQCKIYNGKLITFTNMKEMQTLSSMIKEDSWIGLNGESFLKNTWIDGSKLDYCQFRHTQNMKNFIKSSKNEMCFVLRSKKSEWDAKDCKKYKYFACEQPALNETCPDRFMINIDGDCFGEFLENKSWDEAEQFCQAIGGNKSHLASFHTWDQEATLFKMLSNSNSFWIGLKMFGSTKRWVDNSSLNYQPIIFGTRIDNEFSCFSTKKVKDKDSVWWEKENCAIKKQFLCKISKNKPVIISEQKPIIRQSYYCPRGFIKHDLSCFKFYNERMTWRNASKKCRTMFSKPDPIASLARFDTIYEFESVLSSLWKSNQKMIWIGLMEEKQTNQLLWIDEHPFNINKNVEKKKDNYWQGTVAIELSTNPFSNGRWLLRFSEEHLSYICRVDPHEKYDKYKDNPITESYTKLNNSNCPSGEYVEYNNSCYYYNKEKLNFNDARQACSILNKDARLLIIDNTFEEHFIRSYIKNMKENTNFIWMGLKVDAPNLVKNWKAVDNSSIFYTHWITLSRYKDIYSYPNENPQHKTQGCYVYHISNDDLTNENGMSVSSCDVRLPSVCKITYKRVKSQPVICGRSNNGTLYQLDVMYTKNKIPCVRWDLVNQRDPYLYHLNTKLFSSFPFNKDGYISYSLQRCSEIVNGSKISHGYSCYILKENKYYLEDCLMIPCVPKTNLLKQVNTNNSIVVMISLVLIIVALGFLIYVYRGTLLSNYRVREFLATVLGRYQPDFLRYPAGGRSQSGPSSGTGFVNPIYTPLESRY